MPAQSSIALGIPPSPAPHAAFLNHFLDPQRHALTDIADDLNTSVADLAAWCAEESTIDLLEKLACAFEARNRLLIAQAIPAVIHTLQHVASITAPDDHHATPSVRAKYRDTSRRAASSLIWLYHLESRKANPTNPRPPRKPLTPNSRAHAESPPTPPHPPTPSPNSPPPTPQNSTPIPLPTSHFPPPTSHFPLSPPPHRFAPRIDTPTHPCELSHPSSPGGPAPPPHS